MRHSIFWDCGIIYKKSPRLNSPKTSYEESFLNHKMNLNYEHLHLVHSDNQDDFSLPKSLKILGSNKSQDSSWSKLSKSSFKTKPIKSASPTWHPSSTHSRSKRDLILLRLVNRKQYLIVSTLVILMIVLLLR